MNPMPNVSNLNRIKQLVESGTIDINERYDRSGSTILHRVSKHSYMENYMESIKFLVESGADINATNRYDKTPLQYVAYKHKIHVVQYLVESGADVNAADRSGNTPLVWGSISAPKIETIKILLDYGADKEHRNNNGLTAAYVARRYGHIDAAQFIESYEGVPTKGVNLE